ncbi:transcriptional repressor [bacterium]|nr:transcriptional repressor [candidate division CSSED10-310 bacterium]
MKTSKQELERRMSHFKDVCRNAELKLTRQRLEIFREVAQTGDHPDADGVHRRVRKRIPTVSLDTVYRTLWLLKDLGLITTLGFHHNRSRFDANLVDHHHFVCIRCGSTQDFYSNEFDALRLTETLKSIGSVEAVNVEVRGVCRKCRSKRTK